MSPASGEKLDAVIASWSRSDDTAKFAVNNLLNENGAKAEDYARFLTEVAGAEFPAESPELARHFEEVGKLYRLQGHISKTPSDAILARAIHVRKYVPRLRSTLFKLNCFDNDEYILRNLKLVADKSDADWLPTYQEAIKRTSLGRTPMFGFILNDCKLEWPEWTRSSRTVRAQLGLGADPEGGEYVIIPYKNVLQMNIRVPTVASPGWTYQRWFRPNATAPNDGWGYAINLNTGDKGPREIVHEEVSSPAILFPIKVSLP